MNYDHVMTLILKIINNDKNNDRSNVLYLIQCILALIFQLSLTNFVILRCRKPDHFGWILQL